MSAPILALFITNAMFAFELTGGASLKANIALVMNNAKIGADIACELARLRSS